MRLAVFQSHPIQYFAPLWRALAARGDVDLRVHYYSRHGVQSGLDPGFGVPVAWDIDLLEGYAHEFLPRLWPTRDPLDPSETALNAGIPARLAEGFDVAWVGGYAHVNNWLVARACRRLGIPLLCQLDSNILREHGKARLRLAVKRIVVGAFLRRVARGLAVSDHGRRYLLHYGMPPERIAICPIPVDVDRFRRTAAASADDLRRVAERYGVPADRPVVAFCGKLVPGKRPLDLVRAVARLDVTALFIGDGELRRAILAEGGGRAVVTGFVNQSEIPRALSLARALVLPSSFEAYGLVVPEAMALGIPCVVSHLCGCHGPDAILQDGENGFVVPCGDVDALTAALRRLLDDPDVHARLSRAARHASDAHSPAAAADRLVAAAVAARRSSSPRVS